VAIVSPFYENAMDLAVPRWRFAIEGERFDSLGGWDGHRYRLADQFNALPKALCRSLDRDGFSVIRREGWFTPLPDLKAEFLVRVPYPSEVRDMVEAGPAPTTPPFCHPALLIDSRRPVSLGRIRSLEVIEEPRLAAAIIARRTPRDVYVPEMPPAPMEDLELSAQDEPALCLVGCWPK